MLSFFLHEHCTWGNFCTKCLQSEDIFVNVPKNFNNYYKMHKNPLDCSQATNSNTIPPASLSWLQFYRWIWNAGLSIKMYFIIYNNYNIYSQRCHSIFAKTLLAVFVRTFVSILGCFPRVFIIKLMQLKIRFFTPFSSFIHFISFKNYKKFMFPLVQLPTTLFTIHLNDH